MRPEVEDLDDARMPQRRDGLNLGQKAGPLVRPLVGAAENHLERDNPVESHIERFVNHAHAAAAQFAEDLVIGNLGQSAPECDRRGAGHALFRPAPRSNRRRRNASDPANCVWQCMRSFASSCGKRR